MLVNLWEETGWTGFIQHTLQEGHGPLLASVIVAPFFALIHLPAYFVAGWISDEKMSLNEFPAVLVQVGVIAVFAIFLRTLIMWLYNGSGHSVLIVGLFHSAFNMTNGQKITPELFHLPESLAALIPLAAVAVIAVLLVVFTRGRLAYEPGRSAAPRVAAAGGAAAPQGCNNQPLDRRAPVQAHGDPGLPTQKGEKEMATTATPSRLTTTTRAFPLAAYFVLAYALSWLILVPAGLGLLPDSAGGVLPWLVPFGPAVAAFVVTGLTGGRPAVGQLLRRLVQWRVGVGWYLLVLLSIPLVELMGAFAVLGSAPLDDLARNWPVIFTGYLPAVVYVAIFTGMGEEPGWRGFALPSLQDRHGPLLATAVLAVVWGRWHLPNVLFGGWTGLSFSLWMALTIASTFIYTWVYNHTGGSILMAALLHGAINGGTELVTGLLPGLDDELHLPLYGAVALAFTVAAVVLVVITKGRLGYRAERVPLEAPARS